MRSRKSSPSVLGLAALAVLVRFLLQRGTTLRADETGLTTPAGRRVPFDKVFRIDKRKWKNKGLAAIFYRDEQGNEKKADIDDLKYSGADQVLDRLLGRFSGEVVDLDEPPAGRRARRIGADDRGVRRELNLLQSRVSLIQNGRISPLTHHFTRTIMADETNIEQKVRDIIVEQLGVNADQVTTEAKFIEDLGADSLDTVELVMAFEEEFGIEVPDEEAEKLLTVGDVIRYIEDRAQG